MPNPSEMMRDLTEDAHRRHAAARTYRDNLSLSKGTRELAGRMMRSLEADFPELAEATAKGDEYQEGQDPAVTLILTKRDQHLIYNAISNSDMHDEDRIRLIDMIAS